MKILKKRVLICVFATCLTLQSLPCAADEFEKARLAFERGTKAVVKEDYEHALVAFLESYRVYPKARVLFNIAMCYKAIGLYEEAIAAFRKYLEEAGQSPTPDLRTRAKRALDETIELQREEHQNKNPAETDVPRSTQAEPKAPTSSEEERSANKANSSRPVEETDYNQTNAHMYTETTWSSQKKNRAQRVSGFVALGLGVGAGVVGLVFNIRGQVYYDEALSYKAKWNKDGLEQDLSAYNKLKDEEIPADRIGMTVGYAAATALLVTGTFLLVRSFSKERANDRAQVQWTPLGAVLHF